MPFFDLQGEGGITAVGPESGLVARTNEVLGSGTAASPDTYRQHHRKEDAAMVLGIVAIDEETQPSKV